MLCDASDVLFPAQRCKDSIASIILWSTGRELRGVFLFSTNSRFQLSDAIIEGRSRKKKVSDVAGVWLPFSYCGMGMNLGPREKVCGQNWEGWLPSCKLCKTRGFLFKVTMWDSSVCVCVVRGEWL